MEQPFILRNHVPQGVMETAQFGNHFLTYLQEKEADRLISLQRYKNENEAREGHQRWMNKDWHKMSLKQLMREDVY